VKIGSFLPNAIGRFKTRIEALANVTQLHVDRVRALLRVLLGNAIVLHPISDDSVRCLTAEVSDDHAGVLRLAVEQNKFGGGQGFPPSLTDALRFDIQGVALVA